MVTSRAAVVAGPAEPARSPERLRHLGDRTHFDDAVLGFTTLAAITPIVVAAVRAAARGWLPVGDDAYAAVRAHDVFHGPLPLLGTYSSASQWTHRLLNQPGPLQFDLAAIPVWLFGPGWGIALATAGINVVAVLIVAWLARRLIGARGAALVMLFTVGLAWSLGSETLFDPWNPHATVFPFLAFLFAAWATGCGYGPALPVLALTGSFVLQTHLSYALLVPVVGAWALVACVVSSHHERHARREPATSRLGRWSIAGVVVLVVCWLQPLYQQITGHPGNLGQLLASAGARPLNPPGPKGALQAVGDIVGVPPFWLPPSWGSPPFRLDGTGRPLVLLAAALVVLAAVGAILAVAAWRSEDRVSVVGLITAGLAVAVAGASTAQSTSPFGLVASYLRWLWPISMFTWAVLIVAGVRVVRARGWPRLGRRLRFTAVLAISALAVGVAVLALPSADHGTGATPWAMPVTREIARQAIPKLEGRGTVLLRMPPSEVTFAVGPALFFEFQQHGIPFVTDDASIAASVGTSRRFDGTNARVAVTVVSGSGADHPRTPGSRIAYVHGLSPAEQRELRRLNRQVVGRLRALHGRIPVDEAALHRLPYLLFGSEEALVEKAAGGDLGALANLVRTQRIELDRFPGVDLPRWADLTQRQLTRGTALLLTPVSSS